MNFSPKTEKKQLHSAAGERDQKPHKTVNSFDDRRQSNIAQRQLVEVLEQSPAMTKQRQMAQLMTTNDSITQKVEAESQNQTGMPDNLKSGVESLSGMDMSDVRVHRNSAQPAQLNAHAYAQGNQIHLAPGQEQHLPHEAWHVVQQKQGRVKPTVQAKGVDVNNEAGLEREADVMGAKASTQGAGSLRSEFKRDNDSPTSQSNTKQLSSGSTDAVLQQKSVPDLSNYGNFSDLGNGQFGTTQPTDAGEVSGLVNQIRAKSAAAGDHMNIKILTGTHGDVSGNLVGETVFYTEDMAHEGHKASEGGWTNILNVKGKPKDTIAGWMNPGSSAVILAWCYSKTSSVNWDAIHSYKTGADYQSGNKVW